MVVGVIAIGQTLIILTAGIDLSCGMVMALGGIVMTKLAADLGVPAPLAILCGIGVTALFGLVNGLLVTRIKLPPFIVTLGTFNIAFAITQLYSGAQTVTDVPPLMTWLGSTFPIGGTQRGLRHGADARCCTSACGSGCARPPPAATSTRWATTPKPRAWSASRPNACCSACTCWPACSTASPRCCRWRAPASATRTPGRPRTSTRSPRWCSAAPACSAAAASILGSLVGALVVGVLRNGLTLMGVSSVYQMLITGILVILAVAVDQLSRKGGR